MKKVLIASVLAFATIAFLGLSQLSANSCGSGVPHTVQIMK